MSSLVYIVCNQGDFAIDIQGGARTPKSGTPLDAYTQKKDNDKSPSGNKNQLWHIEPIPFNSGGPNAFEGYYYIRSAQKDSDGKHLFITVKDNSLTPPAAIEVTTLPSDNEVLLDQSWYFMPGPGGYFFIGNSLSVANGAPATVIGIKGGSESKGTALQIQSMQTRESPGGNDYQLWKFVNEKGRLSLLPRPHQVHRVVGQHLGQAAETLTCD